MANESWKGTRANTEMNTEMKEEKETKETNTETKETNTETKEETKEETNTEMGWSVEVLTREEYLKWLYSQEDTPRSVAPILTHSKHVSFY